MPKKFVHPEHHETYLMQELLSICKTGRTNHPQYSTTDGEWHNAPFFDPLVKSLNGWGSANYNPVAFAIRFATQTGVRREVTTKIWLDYVEASKKTFMGVECFSRIYSAMHILAWLTSYKYGGKVVKEASYPILRFWFLVNRLLSNHEGRCLIVGQRSSGHKPNPWFLDWMLERSLGLGDGTKFAKYKPTGNKQWQDFDIFLHLESEAIAIAAGIKDMTIDQVYSEVQSLGVTLRTPYTMVHCEGYSWRQSDWFYAWTPESINSNTAPILGVKAEGSKVLWLPHNGGRRVRQKNDKSRCWKDGNFLKYSGKFTGEWSFLVPEGGVTRTLN